MCRGEKENAQEAVDCCESNLLITNQPDRIAVLRRLYKVIIVIVDDAVVIVTRRWRTCIRSVSTPCFLGHRASKLDGRARCPVPMHTIHHSQARRTTSEVRCSNAMLASV